MGKRVDCSRRIIQSVIAQHNKFHNQNIPLPLDFDTLHYVADPTGKERDVADILYARHIHDEPLKP